MKTILKARKPMFYDLFIESCETIIKNCPDTTVIEVFTIHQNLKLKETEKIVRKGRWYYYKHGKKLIYIRIVKPSLPKGHKTFRCNICKGENL